MKHVSHIGKFFKNPQIQIFFFLKDIWLCGDIYVYLIINKNNI